MNKHVVIHGDSYYVFKLVYKFTKIFIIMLEYQINNSNSNERSLENILDMCGTCSYHRRDSRYHYSLIQESTASIIRYSLLHSI